MSQSLDFEASLAFGAEGEHIVAQWLMGRGVTVAPLYQFKGTDAAPVLFSIKEGEEQKTILPDLTCWKDGECYFAEVKRKNQWVRKYRGLETGIDARHLEHYQRVQEQTGAPIWLFFLHETEEPIGTYAMLLGKHKPRVWDGGGYCHRVSKPIAFWKIDQLMKVA